MGTSITGYAAYVPAYRLGRDSGARSRRVVASFDEKQHDHGGGRCTQPSRRCPRGRSRPVVRDDLACLPRQDECDGDPRRAGARAERLGHRRRRVVPVDR